MSEKPILFNGEMVRATLDGRKTQTRRIMVPQPSAGFLARGVVGVVPQWPLQNGVRWFMADGMSELVGCPHGQPGDRLWVRETWRVDGVEPPPGNFTKRLRVRYRADNAAIWFEQGQWPSGSVLDPEHWTPSIHMPRWASRITLEIVSVRVERLQEISEADAIAEGVTVTEGHLNCAAAFAGLRPDLPAIAPAQQVFCELWESINAKTHSWDSNPFVWRIEFKPQ